MDELTEIRNRAAGFDGMEDFRPGDRALHDALVLHGQVMNGGLLNAVETLETLEERGNELYWAELSDDAILDAAFQTAHARDPEAFAPVR